MANIPTFEMVSGVFRNDGYSNSIQIAAGGTAETVTIPTHTNGKAAELCIFSGTHDFVIRRGGTADITPGDVTNDSAGSLNPVALDIEGWSSMSVDCATTDAVITFEFYMKPTKVM